MSSRRRNARSHGTGNQDRCVIRPMRAVARPPFGCIFVREDSGSSGRLTGNASGKSASTSKGRRDGNRPRTGNRMQGISTTAAAHMVQLRTVPGPQRKPEIGYKHSRRCIAGDEQLQRHYPGIPFAFGNDVFFIVSIPAVYRFNKDTQILYMKKCSSNCLTYFLIVDRYLYLCQWRNG